MTPEMAPGNGTGRAETDANHALSADLDSPRAKLVYLAVALADGATAADLRARLGIRSTDLYPILRTLRRRDLVERNGDAYVCTRRVSERA